MGVDVSLVVPGAVATDGWKIYLIAGDLEPEEIERKRAEQREQSSRWPAPHGMASAVVAAIRDRRYAVIQDNPYQADWFADILERKARDPDAFVLGD